MVLQIKLASTNQPAVPTRARVPQCFGG